MKKILIYDTTLRDGAQAEGITYSVEDKIRILQKIDQIGIDFVEGGWPGSNPKDLDFFKKASKIPLKNSRLVSFGSTRKAGVDIKQDKNITSLLDAGTKDIAVFGKSWGLHVKDVLRTSLEENLNMIYQTVLYLKQKEKFVIFDAEHFFDGFKENPHYAIKTLEQAISAGCWMVCLCDTNGGSLPSYIEEVVKTVKNRFNVPLGIHAHNDGGLAVANSIAAVSSGCVLVQGTINGYGERCGNADLCVVIPNLELKMKEKTSVGEKKLKNLVEVSRFVSEIANVVPVNNQPFVGYSAFAHKGGIHINAVVKNPKTYEHLVPEQVGNQRRLLVSEIGGRSVIAIKACQKYPELKKDTETAKEALNTLQKLEHQGYQFEAADASFELLLRNALHKHTRHFNLIGYRVIVEKNSSSTMHSEATIKIKIKGKLEHTSAEGDGPVNALDNALRKALTGSFPSLSQMHLTDFKVRVLNPNAATAARVRVFIQSSDGKDEWTTVGVSENIIEASWEALVDSIDYKLLKDKVKI